MAYEADESQDSLIIFLRLRLLSVRTRDRSSRFETGSVYNTNFRLFTEHDSAILER
jgi:hypothetical protein